MIPDNTFLINQLQHKNIRPSFQRCKVLQYFYRMEGHPTVDDIFIHLSPEVPSLSRTTIYNTLKLFVHKNLVRELTIDEGVARYDLVTNDHGHFKCENCGTIYNFEIDINQLHLVGLREFTIITKDIIFRGQCPKCSTRKQ